MYAVLMLKVENITVVVCPLMTLHEKSGPDIEASANCTGNQTGHVICLPDFEFNKNPKLFPALGKKGTFLDGIHSEVAFFVVYTAF